MKNCFIELFCSSKGNNSVVEAVVWWILIGTGVFVEVLTVKFCPSMSTRFVGIDKKSTSD